MRKWRAEADQQFALDFASVRTGQNLFTSRISISNSKETASLENDLLQYLVQ